MIQKNINLLIPLFKDIISWIIVEAAEKYKVFLEINETLRTNEVQNAYYAQGRKSLDEVNRLRASAGLYTIGKSENMRIITNVQNIATDRGHGAGMAADLVPTIQNKPCWNAPQSTWDVIGKCTEAANIKFKTELEAAKMNVVWGGSWKSIKDTPHVEIKRI